MRLSKFLAHCGIASRRKAEDLIRHGRIQVNGLLVVVPQYNVQPPNDIVTFDDYIVSSKLPLIYIALYKPAGYLSDLKDPQHRKLARNLIKMDQPIFPVGRLDYNSEGLMIFTNDGEFANRVMHPRYGVEKEYLVKMKGHLTDEDVKSMLQGIRVDDLPLRVKSIEHVKQTHTNSWYLVIVTEGRNRMIRKIGDAINHPVLKLKRIRIGGLAIGTLQPSDYRSFAPEEVEE